MQNVRAYEIHIIEVFACIFAEEDGELSFGAPRQPPRDHFGWNEEDQRTAEEKEKAEKDSAR